MKSRQGFVSNSSSSSFILVLEETSKANIQAHLGPMEPWKVDDLFRQITEYNPGVALVPENLSKISAMVSDPDGYGFPGSCEFDEAWEEYKRGERTWASLELSLNNPEALALLEKFPGQMLYSFSYSDEGGQGEMEHGDHWRKGVKSGRVQIESHH